jgi:hypothetical protein
LIDFRAAKSCVILESSTEFRSQNSEAEADVETFAGRCGTFPTQLAPSIRGKSKDGFIVGVPTQSAQSVHAMLPLAAEAPFEA